MSENVLAVVAGKELTEAQFEAYLKSVPREQQMYAQNPQYREQYKEQFIDLYLFAQLGKDEKMDETDEFKEIMEGAKKRHSGTAFHERYVKRYYSNRRRAEGFL